MPVACCQASFVSTVTDVVQPGQVVTARIVTLDPGANRIGLSLRPADQERQGPRGPPRGDGPPRGERGAPRGGPGGAPGERPALGKVATRGAHRQSLLVDLAGGPVTR